MASGIYLIEHRESGRQYIGRSVDIQQRWYQHKSEALRKDKRSNNPLHNSMRKHGPEAFDWKILATVPDRLHAVLERQFIEDWNTYWPHGYNLGGTEGGFPPRSAIDQMEPEAKARWEETLQRVARTGHEALKELRQDPEYEAWYRSQKSAASTKREAKMRERRAVDPEYDAKERERRQTAWRKNSPKIDYEKGSATFKQRMQDDTEYAERVRANRARAARIAHENRRKKILETAEKLRASLS